MTKPEKDKLTSLAKAWLKEAQQHKANARNGIAGGAYATQEILLARLATRHARSLAAVLRRAS